MDGVGRVSIAFQFQGSPVRFHNARKAFIQSPAAGRLPRAAASVANMGGADAVRLAKQTQEPCTTNELHTACHHIDGEAVKKFGCVHSHTRQLA